MSKETVVHLPIISLVSGAVGRFVCLQSVGMDRFNRKVVNNVFDLSGFDVVFFDLRQRLTDVPGTERSLIVRKV